MAATSSPTTAANGAFSPKATAARAGTPNTTCLPVSRRARYGRFAYFVTRLASGHVERGLPLALRRCGYETLSLYPAFGAFMSARSFQTTTGIEQFYDAHDLRAKDVEPDSFFYDSALKLMSEQAPGKPLFTFVYLAANHFPWETKFRPDLTPDWRAPGNAPSVDEYLRRQAMSAPDYHGFHRRPEEEIRRRAVLDRALWRSPAGVLVRNCSIPRSMKPASARSSRTTTRVITRPITRSTPSISSRSSRRR